MEETEGYVLFQKKKKKTYRQKFCDAFFSILFFRKFLFLLEQIYFLRFNYFILN